jgi:hypothetical protein
MAQEITVAKFKLGQNIAWKWPPGYVTGIVQEINTETIYREIKGKRVTRHGSDKNPAYVLLTKKGVQVIKLESELFDHTIGPNSKIGS